MHACTGLASLKLSGNWLLGVNAVPAALAGMSMLAVLDLSGCGLTHLPHWLAAHTAVTHLHLTSNALTQVGTQARS